MTVKERIKEISEENHGIIKTSDVSKAGIRREVLAELLKDGFIERESRGIYVLAGRWVDEYAILQKKYSKGIFSYGTALYFQGLSDKVPDPISISVPQGYNASLLKKECENVTIHYVKSDWWEVGIVEGTSPQGGYVRHYNMERCICDLVRDKENVEIQLYTQAVKDYFKNKDKNIRRLLKYAQLFQIEEKIRTYVEVLN